jgi:hypothetical protein
MTELARRGSHGRLCLRAIRPLKMGQRGAAMSAEMPTMMPGGLGMPRTAAQIGF